MIKSFGNSELLKRGSMRKRKEFYEYPRRFCKYLNYCAVCNQDIKEGEVEHTHRVWILC